MARIPKDGPVSVRNVMDVLGTDITSRKSMPQVRKQMGFIIV